MSSSLRAIQSPFTSIVPDYCTAIVDHTCFEYSILILRQVDLQPSGLQCSQEKRKSLFLTGTCSRLEFIEKDKTARKQLEIHQLHHEKRPWVGLHQRSKHSRWKGATICPICLRAGLHHRSVVGYDTHLKYRQSRGGGIVEDRRQYRRFQTEFDILIQRAAGSSESIRAKMANFSSSGLCALVQDQIEIGEKVAIEVVDARLTGDPIVVGEGEVVYKLSPEEPSAEPFRIGVRFINPDENMIQRLMAAIQAQNFAESRQRMRAQRDEQKRKSFL